MFKLLLHGKKHLPSNGYCFIVIIPTIDIYPIFTNKKVYPFEWVDPFFVKMGKISIAEQ